MSTVSSCFSPTWLLSPRTYSKHPPHISLPNHIAPRVTFYPLFARPRNSATSAVSSSKNNKNKNKKSNKNQKIKQKLPSDNSAKDDDLDEDAFEALFSQLEEDLKKDGFSLEDFDEDMSEADLAQLELELAEALGDDEMLGSSDSLPVSKVSNDAEENEDEDEDEDVDEDEEEEEEEEEEEDLSNLKTWQLRRLAYALKEGKRKTSIKNLAADVCLDRSLVLKLLRDPPPSLLLMSASLPDKPTPVISEPEERPTETVSLETALEDLPEPDPNEKIPIHVNQSNWSAQKRLKKVQRDTLERVYNRTKRPTNTVVSSIVHVTNLPRKKVVKWFEDRRAEDGVPDQRRPYQRDAATTESVVN